MQQILRTLKWIGLALVLLAVMLIVFRNLEQTNVELIFTTVRTPLAALLCITLLLGFLLGFSSQALWRVRHWRSARAKSKHETRNSGDSR